MSRNNSERMNVESFDSSATSQLSFPKPTEFIDLPTKGKFYPEDHPLHNCESIEIRYMTTKEEEIVNNSSYIQKDIVFDKLLESLIVNLNYSIDDLFTCDKSALIMGARITGYSELYKTNVTCPVCGKTSETTFDLTEVTNKDFENSNFVIEIPLKPSKPDGKIYATVETKLLNGHDLKVMKKISEKKKKIKLPETPIQDLLQQIIVSVNGNSDADEVKSFVGNMYAMHARYLREEYAKITPNINLDYLFSCSNISCGAESIIRIPFDANFFWNK